MKKLYRKILLFLLLLSAICIFFYWINQWVFQKVKPKLPEDIQFISLGTSLSEYALSDSIIHHFRNFSIEGRSALSSFKSMQEIRELNPQLKGFIFDFSIMGTIAYRDYKFFIPLFAPHEFNSISPLVGYKELSSYPLNYKYYVLNQMHNEWVPNWSYWKAYLDQKKGIPPDLSVFPYLGQYKPQPYYRKKVNIEKYKKQLEWAEKFVDTKRFMSTVDLAYVDSILDYSNTINQNVFIFAAPLHKKIIELFPPEYIEKYKSLFEKTKKFPNVRVFNFTNYNLPDSLFINYTHFNKWGAEMISHSFQDSLDLFYELREGNSIVNDSLKIVEE